MCRKLLHDYLFPAYCVYILVEFSMFVQMQGFSEYFHPCFLWHLERGCSSNCFYIRFKPFPFKFSTSRANFFFFFHCESSYWGGKSNRKGYPVYLSIRMSRWILDHNIRCRISKLRPKYLLEWRKQQLCAPEKNVAHHGPCPRKVKPLFLQRRTCTAYLQQSLAMLSCK